MIITGRFIGHLAFPRHLEKSNRFQVLLLSTASSPKEALIEKTWGRPMLYNPACGENLGSADALRHFLQKPTAIPTLTSSDYHFLFTEIILFGI